MDQFEKQLSSLSHLIQPSLYFKIIMRMRLYKRAIKMAWIKKTSFKPPSVRFRWAGAFIVILFFLSGSVTSFAYFRPNVTILNPLFPLKRLVEESSVKFYPDPMKKVLLRENIAKQRMNEMRVIIKNSTHPKASLEKGLQSTFQLFKENLYDSVNIMAYYDEKNELIACLTLMEKDFLYFRDEVQSLHEAIESAENFDSNSKGTLISMSKFIADHLDSFGKAKQYVKKGVSFSELPLILSPPPEEKRYYDVKNENKKKSEEKMRKRNAPTKKINGKKE